MLSFSLARFEFNWCVFCFQWSIILTFLCYCFSSSLLSLCSIQHYNEGSLFTLFSNIKSQNNSNSVRQIFALKLKALPFTLNELALYSRESPTAFVHSRIKLPESTNSDCLRFKTEEKRPLALDKTIYVQSELI